VEAASKEGYPSDRTAFFENASAAGEWLSAQVSSGDLILVKGSRGVKTEQVIQILERDHPLIPRK
jgi:UDP-N-acetylmuramyl pentapeptide synthase